MTDGNSDRLVSIPENYMVTKILDNVGKALIFLEFVHKNITKVFKKVISRENVVIYVKQKYMKMQEFVKVVCKYWKLEEVCKLRVFNDRRK